jgi:hypothetical protein
MLPGIDVVLPHRLRTRTGFRRSLSEGLTVFEMSPRSQAAHEFNSLAGALYPGLVAETASRQEAEEAI